MQKNGIKQCLIAKFDVCAFADALNGKPSGYGGVWQTSGRLQPLSGQIQVADAGQDAAMGRFGCVWREYETHVCALVGTAKTVIGHGCYHIEYR